MALRKFLFQSAEGYSEEQAAADEIALGALTMSGAIAMGANKITGLAPGTVGTDAVNLTQLQSVAAGTDPKASVRVGTITALPAYTQAGSGVGATLTADANGILTIDGVATVLGDRILVKSEAAADADHGIYEVTTEGTAGVPFVLTRSDDYDGNPSGEVSSGSYTFVLEGTTLALTGWMMITDDPITVDTTPLEFTQFTALPDFTWGAGLLNTTNTIAVELDTAADAQGAGSGGGSSGLEFDAVGDGGQLRVKVDPAQGIQRLAAGLGLELDGTTLATAAAGVSVLGVPAAGTWEIGGVATSADVSAANLTELTGGGATTLHSHAGSDSAERVQNELLVAEAISVGDAVHNSSTNDRVGQSDAGVDAEARVIGVATTAQAVVGDPVTVVTAGLAVGVIAAATAGTPYYLQDGGGIGTSVPSGGNRVIQVGVAANATDLWVRIVDYGKKAA